MSTEAKPAWKKGFEPSALPFWAPEAVALLLLAVCTIISLAKQTGNTEAGAHGPIVLATGFWLLFHNGLSADRLRPHRGFGIFGAIALAATLAIYAFGRAYDFISIETAALYVIFLLMFVRMFGVDEVKRQAFPLFYLGFAVPPPGWLIDQITAPLQTLVSVAATAVMSSLNYPIYRQGVVMIVGPYQLMVENACAGMNSITGLTAISLLYIYLMRRASLAYAALLAMLILPVAIAVNIIRVCALVLITYHLGDAAAQGFMHATTGLVLFGLAVIIIFGIDSVILRLLGKQA
jgi:exosortase